MYGDMTYPLRTWTQQGVKHVLKEVPGAQQQGLLAPETRLYINNKPEPENIDLTSSEIDQWESTVDNDGWAVPVTGYCKTGTRDVATPAVIYIHGGGWREGSMKDAHNSMRLLAQLSGAKVFNIEYRLAPEYMYPTATDDCWKVLRYVYNHAEELGVDPQRITITGDSAGGNMAAVCAHRDRNQRRGMVAQQILVYPVLALAEPEYEDYHFSVSDYEWDDSEAEVIKGAICATARLRKELYLGPGDDPRSPDISPLLDKNLRELPKTILICAEYDALTQQCREYARQLAGHGTDTTLMIYRGTVHGFMSRLGNIPQATDLIKEMARYANEI